jgi:5-methylcytosine-specific restriction endonuclease McrA
MFRVLEGVRRCATHAADKLTGDAVRARDRVCLRCGADGPLDWAHIVPRSRSAALRWSIGDAPDAPANNAIALCRRCHEWQGAHPELAREFLAGLNVDVRALERLADSLRRGPTAAEVVMRLETAA